MNRNRDINNVKNEWIYLCSDRTYIIFKINLKY